jgi:hypothetical protein
MNHYLTSLLSSPIVAAIGGGTMYCSTFVEIRTGLENAMLMNLTELPWSIANYANPEAAPGFNMPTSQGADSVPRESKESKNPKMNRQQLLHPEWNQNLKRAWTTLGVMGLYSVGAPFHDESQPNNKKIIMSDMPNKRICLSMAMNGFCYSNCNGLHKCLSAGEVNRVTAAGGITLE